MFSFQCFLTDIQPSGTFNALRTEMHIARTLSEDAMVVCKFKLSRHKSVQMYPETFYDYISNFTHGAWQNSQSYCTGEKVQHGGCFFGFFHSLPTCLDPGRMNAQESSGFAKKENVREKQIQTVKEKQHQVVLILSGSLPKICFAVCRVVAKETKLERDKVSQGKELFGNILCILN